MSKYTAKQVSAQILDEQGNGCYTRTVDMLRDYAAYLTRPEWPSDDGVERFCESMAVQTKTVWADYPEEDKDACRKATRAALQSVRPPAEVVSDEDVDAAFVAMDAAFRAEYPAPHNMGAQELRLAKLGIRAALESYASRRASTKD